MQLGIKLAGGDLAGQRLAAVGRTVEPVMRGALNTTATKSRNDRYIRPMRGSIKAQRLRSSLKIKRANTRRLESRIIPSSSSILVVNYQSWGFDQIDATRARLWVRGPGRRKVAAGFVNPASAHRLPLGTRSSKAKGNKTYSYNRPLQLALGPSAAYWFRQLTDGQTVRWVNAYLQQEFEKRIRRELAKYR